MPFSVLEVPALELATGMALDAYGFANGARARKPGEPDDRYRAVVIDQIGSWAVIHPAFGGSFESEREGINGAEKGLIERKRRFNIVAKHLGKVGID